MKILIVRHGDPNYEIDGLTEKGQREVQLLADRLCKEDIKAAYCSTMGRAKLTAAPTLERLGLTAEYCDWLREFNPPRVKVPYQEQPRGCWDLLPYFVNEHPDLYSPTAWKNVDFLRESEVPARYDWVCQELDKVLARHGYVRDGFNYRAERPNHDTIMFVCHYGLSCVLLSHLMNCSPYSIWQNGFTAPTAVSTFYTEERIRGTASMRFGAIGDVSHLYARDEEASFSGRFCECFTDDTRH